MEAKHFAEVDGDGFTLALFFGLNAGVSTGGIDKGEDGHLEAAGVLHEAQGFAIATGIGHAKVAGDVIFGIAPLLMAEHHDRLTRELGDTAHEGRIIKAVAIAVEFKPVVANGLDIIEGGGAAGV